jgi:hypothetical protein
MRMTCCLALLLGVATAANAGWYGEYGNDTGGIIPWSPEVSTVYKQVAAHHCAQYDKIARITSVHRWYGDYVGFVCAFPRGYDPEKAWYYGAGAWYGR